MTDYLKMDGLKNLIDGPKMYEVLVNLANQRHVQKAATYADKGLVRLAGTEATGYSTHVVRTTQIAALVFGVLLSRQLGGILGSTIGNAAMLGGAVAFKELASQHFNPNKKVVDPLDKSRLIFDDLDTKTQTAFASFRDTVVVPGSNMVEVVAGLYALLNLGSYLYSGHLLAFKSLPLVAVNLGAVAVAALLFNRTGTGSLCVEVDTVKGMSVKDGHLYSSEDKKMQAVLPHTVFQNGQGSCYFWHSGGFRVLDKDGEPIRINGQEYKFNGRITQLELVPMPDVVSAKMFVSLTSLDKAGIEREGDSLFLTQGDKSFVRVDALTVYGHEGEYYYFDTEGSLIEKKPDETVFHDGNNYKLTLDSHTSGDPVFVLVVTDW